MFRRMGNPERLRRAVRGPYRYTRLRWRVLARVIDTVGGALFSSARAVGRLAYRPPEQGAPFEPRRILLVQLDHLGDAVISTAVLPMLRKRYPQGSIEVLAGPWNRELFEAMDEVDRVHVSRANRFARCGRWAWPMATLYWGLRLRRRRFDLAIDLRGEFPHALLLWLSGARRRVGWACGGGRFLLTDWAAYVPERPEVASRMALLAAAGIEPPEPAACRPTFRPPEAARRAIRHRLAQLAPVTGAPGPRIVIHPGAGTPAKMWPAQYWRTLVAELLASGHGPVFLVGSVSDCRAAAVVRRGMPPAAVIDWTGRWDIAHLGALLEQADLMIGADSGPGHLAAAVGTPVVSLFSGTNSPRQWRPGGSPVAVVRHPVPCSPCHRNRCPLPDHPCMRGLRPKLVFQAAARLLDDVTQAKRRQKDPLAARDPLVSPGGGEPGPRIPPGGLVVFLGGGGAER